MAPPPPNPDEFTLGSMLIGVIVGIVIGILTVVRPRIGVGLMAVLIVSGLLDLFEEKHAHVRVYCLISFSLSTINQVILQLLIHRPQYVNIALHTVFFASGAGCLLLLIELFDMKVRADVRGVELNVDGQLYLNFCNYCEQGWFYAVALAQLAVVRYELKSKTLVPGTELRRLRRSVLLTEYNASLAKSSLFVGLIVLGQLIALGLSTRSVTEYCISIAIACVLLDRVCLRE
jgi:hypothetical protein